MADRFSDFSILLGYMPFYFGEYVRYIYYRVFLKNVGWGTVFKFGSFVQYRESSIGYRCLTGYFNAVGLVEIGDDVLCGGYINFTSGLRQHSFNNPDLPFNKHPGSRTCINIGSDVWIGNNCVICANIGNRVVNGAGSTVVTDCIDKTVYAGNPAKMLKEIK